MQLRLPQKLILPSPRHAAAALLVGEVIWLSLLYPLVPGSLLAWVVTLFLPIPIVMYGYFALGAVCWLSPQSPASKWRQLLAALVAISFGVLVFLAVYCVEHQLSGQFHYG